MLNKSETPLFPKVTPYYLPAAFQGSNELEFWFFFSLLSSFEKNCQKTHWQQMGWAKDVKEKQQVMEMQTNPVAASCFSQRANRHRQVEAWNGMGRTHGRGVLASVVTLRITRDWSVPSDVPWSPHPFPALGMPMVYDVTPLTPCIVFAAALWVWLRNIWCSQEYPFFPGLRWIDLILSVCVIKASAWADHNPSQPMEQSPGFPDGW